MPHPIVDRPFAKDPSGIAPIITAETRTYWDGLKRGEFWGQRCDACATVQVPGGPVCAHCGSRATRWELLSGRANLFAWVRYHRPYLPEFEDILPYVTAVVELAEGARLFARLVCGGDAPRIGARLIPLIERWPDGTCVPVFSTDLQGAPS